MSSETEHDARVRAWMDRLPTTPGAPARLHAAGAAADALLRRAARTLDPVTTAAIATRAVAATAARFPHLTVLRTAATDALELDELAPHVAALPAADLDEALRALLTELLTALDAHTGRVLTAALRDAIAQVPSGNGANGAPAPAPARSGADARRFDALCAATAALARPPDADADVARAVDAIARALDAALPLHTLTLVLHPRGARARVHVWHRGGEHAAGAGPREAESRARVAYAYLTGSTTDLLGARAELHALAARPDAASTATSPHDPIALPLAVPGRGTFGVLQLEPAAPVDADDVRLFAAVTRQLAATLDARLDGPLADGGAESTSALQREYFSVISHDLRNPLSAILMSAALLLRRAQGAEANGDQHRQLEVIKRSAERMNHQIQNLVDAVCAESGALSVEPQVLPLAPVIADGCRLLTSAAGSKSVRLVNAVADDAPALPLDRERMVQVTANLIQAAIKLAGRGGVVTLRVHAAEPDEVQLAVESAGPGLADADAARVFDRRWWESPERGLGTGLGVGVARDIIVAHGGRVWLANQAGVGCTFFVALPREAPVPPTTPPAA